MLGGGGGGSRSEWIYGWLFYICFSTDSDWPQPYVEFYVGIGTYLSLGHSALPPLNMTVNVCEAACQVRGVSGHVDDFLSRN